MRFEIVNRQRFQHAVFLAQILFAISAHGQAKPTLLVIGHPTSHGWKNVEHPAFTTRIIDPDVEPRLAAAYTAAAKIIGTTGDPLFVVVSQYMEPLAASRADAAFLDRIAARWKTDRDGLVAESGLAIRRYLLSGRQAPSPVRTGEAPVLHKSPRYDHIGGGFFRCDQCFDKTLADQAFYANAYLDARRKTNDPIYADVVRSTLDFVLSDLTNKNGQFVAGQNADSLVARGGPELLEGGHYLWQANEIRHLLGAKAGGVVLFHYGAKDEGNMPQQSDSHDRNLLVPRAESETIAKFGITRQELADALKTARKTLLEVRSNRPKPAWYTPVITSHNASMISALARASRAFDEPRYSSAALRAARALRPKTLTPEEHALLVTALFDVYDATFDPSILERAVALTPGAPEQVPEPVASLAPKSEVVRAPSLNQFRHLIIAGDPSRSDTKTLIGMVRGSQRPGDMIILLDSEYTRRRLASFLPYLNDISAVDEPRALVCERRACRQWTE